MKKADISKRRLFKYLGGIGVFARTPREDAADRRRARFMIWFYIAAAVWAAIWIFA